VAHAETEKDADASEGEDGTTVIVYGLEPGKEYEIGVDIVREGEEDQIMQEGSVEVETRNLGEGPSCITFARYHHA